MERRKENRSLLKYIVFTILTFGIYGLIFNWNLYKDLNIVCRVKEEDDSYNSPNYLVACIFSLFTFGIYHYFWLYKQGNRIKKVGKKYGLDIDESGTTLLMWSFFGVLLFGIGPIIAYYFLISNINRLCIKYNKEYVDGIAAVVSAASSQPESYNSLPLERYPQAAQSGSWEEPPYRRESLPDNGGNVNRDIMAITMEPGRGTEDATVLEERHGVLEAVAGELKGAQIILRDQEKIVIGRNADKCNIILSAADVSRVHCEVKFSEKDDCFFIKDYSTYGVYINGVRVAIKGNWMRCARGTGFTLGNGKNEFLFR